MVEYGELEGGRRALRRRQGWHARRLSKRKTGCRSVPAPGSFSALDRRLPLATNDVVAVEIHHLGPRRHKILGELLLRVLASIDFREGAELRVRAEDQVDAAGGPLGRI